MTPEINWFPEDSLKWNAELSKTMYEDIENDFITCLDYVPLSQNHMNVYSPKFAGLILRIGPEVLRLFDITLFNKKRRSSFFFEGELEPLLLDLQRKRSCRKDGFIHYLKAMSAVNPLQIAHYAVEVMPLGLYIFPFKTEERTANNGRPYEVVPCWQDGYNALRHRTAKEFKKTATLKNTLFLLAALWVVYDAYLCPDWGFYLKSQLFKITTRTNLTEGKLLPYQSE